MCEHVVLLGMANGETGEIVGLMCAACGESDPRVLFAGDDDNANGYERQRQNASTN